jgi:hypothetical protein
MRVMKQTDLSEVQLLNAQADRCRRLARTIGDRQAVATLDQLAREYEAKAYELNSAKSSAN